MPTATRIIKEKLKHLEGDEKDNTIKSLVFEQEVKWWRKEVLKAYRDRELGNFGQDS